MTFIEFFLESVGADVKKYYSEVKNLDVSQKSISRDALGLYHELIRKIKSYKYEDSVEFIDQIVKDPKLKFLLSLGYGGKFADMQLNIASIQVPVTKLIPTQSEIDMTNSLKYILQGKDIESCFFDPVVIIRPIITFNGKYIVDGHHRWSQIYLTNPNAQIACLDICGKLTPLEMLKAVQSTIGTNLGYLESRKVKGTSLYDANESTVRKYINANITPKAIKEIERVIGKDPCDYLTKNCLMLKNKNKPIKGAPERGFMPQTSHDPQLFSDLKNGIVNPKRI